MLRFRTCAPLFSLVSLRCVFQSKEFATACQDLPTTPGGHNPYDVLEITVTQSTSMDDVSKQFRSMVVKNHPDKPGGSTEKMSEINLAYKIVKENHDSVLRKMKEAELNVQATDTFRQHRQARRSRDEDLGRSGGVHRRTNAKVAQEAARSAGRARSLREIETQWAKMREETDAVVKSMCSRYELAIEQGKFFRKTSSMSEITTRERWLRKAFIKGVWEDIHELRGELLRRGARSAQQSELAEEMVSYASVTQRKLNEDFQRLTQESVQSQTRIYLERGLGLLCMLIAGIKFFQWFFTFVFRNSFTVRLKKGILSQ